ncbi:MAG: hypothetical protein GIX03_05825 [Candidatus Eremiobacteraeota bacterium]|nr:hypothetical protein [Candidatus Eremiobacteraeota bacterium]MBC5802515.1 hypothetical protein [Candidatus Eremiobacteraeota bacterium]MBC5820532.1 hypothetical protein [Candidatus Eremiobacteraeota bacterium]
MHSFKGFLWPAMALLAMMIAAQPQSTEAQHNCFDAGAQRVSIGHTQSRRVSVHITQPAGRHNPRISTASEAGFSGNFMAVKQQYGNCDRDAAKFQNRDQNRSFANRRVVHGDAAHQCCAAHSPRGISLRG